MSTLKTLGPPRRNATVPKEPPSETGRLVEQGVLLQRQPRYVGCPIEQAKRQAALRRNGRR